MLVIALLSSTYQRNVLLKICNELYFKTHSESINVYIKVSLPCRVSLTTHNSSANTEKPMEVVIKEGISPIIVKSAEAAMYTSVETDHMNDNTGLHF